MKLDYKLPGIQLHTRTNIFLILFLALTTLMLTIQTITLTVILAQSYPHTWLGCGVVCGPGWILGWALKYWLSTARELWMLEVCGFDYCFQSELLNVYTCFSNVPTSQVDFLIFINTSCSEGRPSSVACCSSTTTLCKGYTFWCGSKTTNAAGRRRASRCCSCNDGAKGKWHLMFMMAAKRGVCQSPLLSRMYFVLTQILGTVWKHYKYTI